MGAFCLELSMSSFFFTTDFWFLPTRWGRGQRGDTLWAGSVNRVSHSQVFPL